MRRFSLTVLALSSAITLAACNTLGNKNVKALTERSASQVLVPGVTTRVEIGQALGKGESLRFDSGYEIRVYRLSNGLPAAINYVPIIGLVTSQIHRSTKELRLLFDPNGVLKKYLLLEPTVADEKTP